MLEHDGIDHAGVRVVDDLPTGRALITVGDDGENSIVVVPGANAAVVVDSMPAARVVLAQLEIPLDAVVDAFRLARASGATTVLNPAPAAELPDELLAPDRHRGAQRARGGAARRTRAPARTWTGRR